MPLQLGGSVQSPFLQRTTDLGGRPMLFREPQRPSNGNAIWFLHRRRRVDPRPIDDAADGCLPLRSLKEFYVLFLNQRHHMRYDRSCVWSGTPGKRLGMY